MAADRPGTFVLAMARAKSVPSGQEIAHAPAATAAVLSHRRPTRASNSHNAMAASTAKISVASVIWSFDIPVSVEQTRRQGDKERGETKVTDFKQNLLVSLSPPLLVFAANRSRLRIFCGRGRLKGAVSGVRECFACANFSILRKLVS
jgi:hypothetical protein